MPLTITTYPASYPAKMPQPRAVIYSLHDCVTCVTLVQPRRPKPEHALASPADTPPRSPMIRLAGCTVWWARRLIQRGSMMVMSPRLQPSPGWSRLVEVAEYAANGTMLGGETGIRTLGTVARTVVFETTPFDHSGISPLSKKAAIAASLINPSGRTRGH